MSFLYKHILYFFFFGVYRNSAVCRSHHTALRSTQQHTAKRYRASVTHFQKKDKERSGGAFQKALTATHSLPHIHAKASFYIPRLDTTRVEAPLCFSTFLFSEGGISHTSIYRNQTVTLKIYAAVRPLNTTPHTNKITTPKQNVSRGFICPRPIGACCNFFVVRSGRYRGLAARGGRPPHGPNDERVGRGGGRGHH